jgi:hypothetical protein
MKHIKSDFLPDWHVSERSFVTQSLIDGLTVCAFAIVGAILFGSPAIIALLFVYGG